MRIPSSSNFKDDIGTFSFPPRVLLRRKSFPWRPGLTEKLNNCHYDVDGIHFWKSTYTYIVINLQVLRFEGYGILELMFGNFDNSTKKTHCKSISYTKFTLITKQIIYQYETISRLLAPKNGHHHLPGCCEFHHAPSLSPHARPSPRWRDGGRGLSSRPSGGLAAWGCGENRYLPARRCWR